MVKFKTSRATSDSTAVWDHSVYPSFNEHSFARQQGLSYEVRIEPYVTLCSISELIHKYEKIWRGFKTESISLSTMRYAFERCEQELLEKDWFMKFCSTEYTESIITLLHIHLVISVQQSQSIKFWVLHELTIQLTKKSEIELYDIFNEYIDQLMIRKSMVTEKDLCIRQIDPYYELLLKLCYGEKLIKQKKYEQYNEFMGTNETFFKSMITEMKTGPDYEKMSKTCIFLLYLINSDTSCRQPGGFLFQEERTCLLSDLLSMLPQGLFYKVFEVFLEKVEMMNLSVRFLEKSEIDSKYLHSVKTDTYINLLFKLFWCRKLINEGHADDNIVYRCLNNLYRGKGPKKHS